MKEKITINSQAIKPISDCFETQIILQRHCSYDRVTGDLLEGSKSHQKELVSQFLHDLESLDVENTYFLFIASDTTNSNGEQKRCVETTEIAMNLMRSFLETRGIDEDHIINLDESLNYDSKVKQTKRFSEPTMFTDETGYLEFLKNKNDGMGLQFWIDFEEDTYKEKREELNAEGPDEIVARGVHYIKVIQRFSEYFHAKKPNSKLIVWCGTHYDLISPLAKQTIFGYDKSDVIAVDYCGGISFGIDKDGGVVAYVNGHYFEVCFEEIKSPRRRL